MVLTHEAHIFMWQVRMGSSQGEMGQTRFPWPTGLGYRLRETTETFITLLEWLSTWDATAPKEDIWKWLLYKGD